MAASAQPAKPHGQPAVAAIDLDQDDWYVAVGDVSAGETRLLRDASQLAACVGSAATVLATEECRNELLRAVPQIQAQYAPRLESVARAFRKEIDGAPCLVLWIGRKIAACGLVIDERLVEEKSDSQLTLAGIFQHFAETVPGLQAWMKSPERDEHQRAVAFDRFVANLRDGTALDVGGLRWMRKRTRVPALATDGFRRLRARVDPQERATKLVLSGWASAAHWDLPETLGAAFDKLSLISRPNGAGFYESVAGLMDYEWVNQPVSPPGPPAESVAPPEQAVPATGTASQPPIEAAPPAPEPAPEPPAPPLPQVAAPEPPPPPPVVAPDPRLREQAQALQGKPVVRLAKAAGVLFERLGSRGAALRQSLKPYLALAQQAEHLSEVMAGTDNDAQLRELNSFRAAISKLEKFDPADFFPLLDPFPSAEPEAVEIRKQAGIEAIDPEVDRAIPPSDKLAIVSETGKGKLVKVRVVHGRGYKVQGEVVRKPMVEVERFAPRTRSRIRPRPWWMAFGVLALAVLTLTRFCGSSAFQRVATAAVGEPVLNVWSLPGASRLVAQTGDGQCSLRIWQAPRWTEPVVLPATCGPVAVSPDGSLAAWSALDSYLPAITKTSNVPLQTMGPQSYQHSAPIRALAFTPDGQFLYSAGADGYVRKWNVQTGGYVQDLPDDGDRLPFQSLLVAGNLVAAGEAGTNGARIKVWLPQGQELVLLAGARQGITAMAYDAETSQFFAGAEDGQVLIWGPLRDHYAAGSSLQDGWSQIPVADKPQGIALAPGARVFVSYPHSVLSWRYTTEMTPGPHFSFGSLISGATVVNDGQNTFLAVASGGGDHSIGIWRIAK